MDIPTIGISEPSKGPRRLSARALGVLTYLHATGSTISAERLSQVFTEGREAMRTALSELREYNLISTTQERVGNRIITVTRLVEPSLWAPETRLLIQQTQQNSNLALSTYSFISKKEYIRERMGEEMIDDYDPSPMYLEPEERAELARKNRERQQAAFRELKEQQAQERIQTKASKKPEHWSSDDSAYHFAQRVELNWHIKPWLTARTRFKAAFGQARKTYGTTGDQEMKMMDIFFDALEHQRNMDDPEIIWKAFIKQFPTLLSDVLRTTVTEEDKQRAREIADAQWEDFGV